MFITLQRLLPDSLVDCLINVDHVVWVQALLPPDKAQTQLRMANGDIVATPESYPRVQEKLVRR